MNLVYRCVPYGNVNQVLELIDVYNFHYYNIYRNGGEVVVGLTEDDWEKLSIWVPIN